MYNAVIFDKDGVLIHTIELYFERWKKTFNNFNKKLDRSFYQRRLMGRSAHESIRKHIKPDISNEELTIELQEQLQFTISNFNKYVRLVDGVVEFLKKLKEAKIPTALATSSRIETTDHVLDTFGLRKYFNSVVTANDIKNAKPNPEIFLTAAKRLKVKPESCIAFEDSHSGIEAAKKAGMKVVLVMTSHSKREIPDVALAIKDFSQLTLQDLKMI